MAHATVLHVTDMDSTMVPPSEEGKESAVTDNPLFSEDEGAFASYKQMCSQHNVVFVPSSGRTPVSVMETVRLCNLPRPPFVIGGVGTEIMEVVYNENGGFSFKPLSSWEAHINQNWNPEVVAQCLAEFLICREGDSLQPENRQSRFKKSAWAHKLSDAELRKLENSLKAAGVQAQIVYSSERDLDIIPEAAGKGNAAAFLAELLKVAPENTLVTGDSLNDSSLFETAGGKGWRAGLPSNAHDGLRDVAQAISDLSLHESTRPRLHGVLDAFRHFFSRLSPAPQTANTPRLH